MSNFFLIRNQCGIHCDSYYEEKTDVFGWNWSFLEIFRDISFLSLSWNYF